VRERSAPVVFAHHHYKLGRHAQHLRRALPREPLGEMVVLRSGFVAGNLGFLDGGAAHRPFRRVRTLKGGPTSRDGLGKRQAGLYFLGIAVRFGLAACHIILDGSSRDL